MLEYTLKRSKRKTLAAYVLDDGTVEVRAPLKMPSAQIERFLAEREATLGKYVKLQLEQAEERERFSVEIGEKIIFLGEEYTICRGAKTEIADRRFYVTDGNVKNQVAALYRLAAERIIRERVFHYTCIMGLTPSSVKINAAKSRWGSCSAKNALNFSWYLVMASPEALDYVVIHELSHMRHMDHSDAFWREVAKYEPEYRIRRKELAALAKRLRRETWE